jgi:hypothetical protein
MNKDFVYFKISIVFSMFMQNVAVMIMTYFNTKFHKPKANDSFDTVMKSKRTDRALTRFLYSINFEVIASH